MTDIDTQYLAWRQGLEEIDNIEKLFLVGCAKSGTSWVLNLLNGHPNIACHGEGRWAWALFPVLFQAFDHFNKDQQGRLDMAMVQPMDRIMYCRAIMDTGFLRYVATEMNAGKKRIKIVGDKTPQHTVRLDILAQIYPKARFIHIVRDPRDVTTSALFHLYESDHRSREEYIEYFMTEVWPLNVGTAHQTGKRLGEDRYMAIRYEDLHADEPTHVQNILQWLNVAANPQILEHCLDNASFTKRSGGRARGEADAGSHYRKGIVGDWREHLPTALVDACCSKIQPLMAEMGYRV